MIFLLKKQNFIYKYENLSKLSCFSSVCFYIYLTIIFLIGEKIFPPRFYLKNFLNNYITTSIF